MTVDHQTLRRANEIKDGDRFQWWGDQVWTVLRTRGEDRGGRVLMLVQADDGAQRELWEPADFRFVVVD
jgi:hypothetical protein